MGFSEDASDGSFWMTWEDLTFYFSRVQVAKVNDNYLYSFIKANHKKESFSLLRLVVPEAGEHTISVAQKDARCYMRGIDYEYSYCRVLLLKIKTDLADLDADSKTLEAELVGREESWERETHVECAHLEKGEYHVLVEMEWNENTHETDFCVTCYGASATTFTGEERALLPKEMLAKVGTKSAYRFLRHVCGK